MFKRSVYNKQGILYYAYRDVIDMNGQRSLSFCYFVIFSSRRQWRQQKHFQNQAPIHFRNINLIKPVPSLIQVYIYIFITKSIELRLLLYLLIRRILQFYIIRWKIAANNSIHLPAHQPMSADRLCRVVKTSVYTRYQPPEVT